MKTKDKIALAKQLIGCSEKEVHTYHERGVTYRILIVFRGEGLFYAEDEKCLVLDKFSAQDAVLSMNGIRKWLDGTPFTEPQQVVANLKMFYQRSYQDVLRVQDR